MFIVRGIAQHFLFLFKRKRRLALVLTLLFLLLIIWSFGAHTSFIEVQNVDLNGGTDFECDGSLVKGKCVFITTRSSYRKEGKIQCIIFGTQCKGFVYNMGSNMVVLKSNVAGKLSFSPGVAVFVKTAYSSGLNLTVKHEDCAPELSKVNNGNRSSSGNEMACSLPSLNPFDPSIVKLIVDKGELKCNGKSLTQLENGKLRIVDDGSDVKVTKVEFKAVKWKPNDDFSYDYGKTGTLLSKDKEIQLDEEFVLVNIYTSDGNMQKDFHLEVQPKKNSNEKLDSQYKPGIPLNILMIGFDSTSHSQFIRKLPKVHSMLVDDPDSFIFKGHAVLGDGTPPALIGMMVGSSEEELPEARRSEGLKAECVDRWTFIFGLLKKYGYATLYSEDQPDYGTFWYRLKGFCKQPTDHYTRPYFLAHARETGDQGERCLGSQPSFQRSFDYLRNFNKAYPDTLKFSFTFTCLGHDDFNDLGYAQNGLLKLIHDFRHDGYLNNTIMMLFGDHGTRYGDIRSTVIGKLEERLPFFSITVPPWFRRKYPSFVKNMEINTERLTTPYDVHALLKQLLFYPQKPKLDRGISLFEEIELSRTCETAKIPQHFCPCLEWKPVDLNHKHIKLCAQSAVNYMKKLVVDKGLSHKCEKLQLKLVSYAVKVEPNKAVQKFSQETRDAREGSCDYQLQFQTAPNNGIYEITAHVVNGEVNVVPIISRLNKYGNQPRCIMEQYPYMRKFCYCKK